MHSKITFMFLLLLFLAACKKEETLSIAPSIEFKNVSPAEVKEYKDKITFTIFYRDGDGDLGENNADVKNLFLTDLRNNVTYEYRIQQLAPTGANVPIQGNINIELNNTAIIDDSNTQTVTYSIYVLDRAGNKSNTITTSSITITK